MSQFLWIPIGIMASVVYLLFMIYLSHRRDKPMIQRIMENDKKIQAMSKNEE